MFTGPARHSCQRLEIRVKELNPFLPNAPHMDTDRTRVKASHSNLPVPASAPGILEAHQRAPTLMAGETSGGEVQVWAPNKWFLRACCGFWGLLFAMNLCLAVTTGLKHSWDLFLNPLIQMPMNAIWFAICWRLLRRPRYAATDASGIAITTEKGSVTVSWADIQSIQCWADRLILVRRSDNSELTLPGYTRPSHRVLVGLIVTQAGLQQDPSDSKQFLNLAEMARQDQLKALTDRSKNRGREMR